MTPLLDVKDLNVAYGGVQAVNNVSLSAEHGRIIGLIGPNGAGKTSLIDAITGFAPYTGTVSFRGRPIDDLSAHQRARRGLRRTFQEGELIDGLNVAANVEVAVGEHRWWQPLIDLLAPQTYLQGKQTQTALELLEIAGLAHSDPTRLSHGQRKLVGVARAVVANPDLLILDEPAAGLDSSETDQFSRQLVRLRDQGAGILLVDHDTDLVFDVCDEVFVLDVGQIIAKGVPAAVRNDATVIRAYLGTA